ncbi:MAG: hypothetical protein GC164_16325 [Phycisphaera sp.]|nr:hypothetical protein [Phycisphaera sp.]
MKRLNLQPVTCWAHAIAVFGVLCLCLSATAYAQYGVYKNLPMAMESDPVIETVGSYKVFSPRLMPLWVEALSSPETWVRVSSAQTIAKAYARGMDVTAGIEPLAALLTSDQAPREARLAAAKALAEIDARTQADALYATLDKLGQDDRVIVEPTLDRWGYAPIREDWLKRLSDPQAPITLRVIAAQGLGNTGDERAVEPLRTRVFDTLAQPGLRIGSAKALAAIKRTGLEEDARALITSSRDAADTLPRLLGVLLISNHKSPVAVRTLATLALDPDSPIVVAAMKAILVADPLAIKPIQQKLLTHSDASVRSLAIQAVRAQKDASAVAAITPLLDDVHPDVRTLARTTLIDMAEHDGLREAVLTQAGLTLKQTSWRCLEQATHVVVALDEKPMGMDILPLFTHKREEVRVTACWAMEKLRNKETLPTIVERVVTLRELYETAFHSGSPSDPETPIEPSAYSIDMETAHLNQAIGLMGHRDAEELLWKFIPKGSACGAKSRAAAVWTLGHFHAGVPDAKLAGLLRARLSDVNPINPETPEVRLASAIALGRMKDTGSLVTLRKFMGEEGFASEIGVACAWAVGQITGTPVPRPDPAPANQTGFFLQPVE